MEPVDGEYANSPSCSKLDSTGTLRTKISMVGKNPAVVMPFYLLNKELPAKNALTGSKDLLAHYGLDRSLARFSGPSKLKEELSSFLTHLPGKIDAPSNQDSSSLRTLLDKPPIPKEIAPLSSSALLGFRLSPGQALTQYQQLMGVLPDKKKHKKKRKRAAEDSIDDEIEGSKSKRLKRDDEAKDRRKKKKKDKKRKARSPEHGIAAASSIVSVGEAHDMLHF